MIHTVKGFGIVSKAEVDVFLELSCFFNDSTDIGNLISVSSAFSKSSLNIWTFTVHILLKPGLRNFEYYFVSVWDECNRVAVWVCMCVYVWIRVWVWMCSSECVCVCTCVCMCVQAYDWMNMQSSQRNLQIPWSESHKEWNKTSHGNSVTTQQNQ